MLIKIKLLLLIFLLLILNSCLTPLDGDSGEDTDVYPLQLQTGKGWRFRIYNSDRVSYLDSFYVREYKPISYRNKSVNAFRVSQPALHHYDNGQADTLLVKYWGWEDSKLVEYGWEKKHRWNYDLPAYESMVYPESLIVVDFSTDNSKQLYNYGDVSAYQSAVQDWSAGDGSIKKSIAVYYFSTGSGFGLPSYGYSLYFATGSDGGMIYDLDGWIDNIRFSANPI